MASGRSRCGAPAMCSSSRACSARSPARIRTTPRSPCSRRCSTDEPSGRLYKALVETKKAASVSGSASGFAEAGFVEFQRRSAAGKIARRREDDAARGARGHEEESADRGGGDPRADAPAEELRAVAQAIRPHRAALERIDRARRLAARVSRSRSARKGHARRRRARRGALSEAVESHRRPVHSRAERRPHRGAGRAGHRRAAQGLQRQAADRAGRRFRGVAGEHREAHHARRSSPTE